MKKPDKKIYKHHKEIEKVEEYLSDASFLLLDLSFKDMDNWQKMRVLLAQMIQLEALNKKKNK